jgi:hypothetical protein
VFVPIHPDEKEWRWSERERKRERDDDDDDDDNNDDAFRRIAIIYSVASKTASYNKEYV